jgi:probable F420-dependent oxidoreductase
VTTALRVGVQLPEVERRVGWPELRAMARAAEESGFDSIWLGDHLLYRGDGLPERGPWDVWTTLSALAASTERVRLGPLVACTAFHPPGMIARMAATIDEVSDRRFVLGIGAGWNRTEFDAFGIAYDQRAARFEEAFEIVRRLLDGERVTFGGRFHRTEDAVLLPEPSHRPALMVGSTGERVLRATLPHVDAWNTWYDAYGNRPKDFEELNARITDLAREAGRRPEEVERSACTFVVLDHPGERPVPDGITPLEGSKERIAQGLRELADAGADEAILVLSPITERSIRQIGAVIDLLGA